MIWIHKEHRAVLSAHACLLCPCGEVQAHRIDRRSSECWAIHADSHEGFELGLLREAEERWIHRTNGRPKRIGHLPSWRNDQGIPNFAIERIHISNNAPATLRAVKWSRLGSDTSRVMQGGGLVDAIRTGQTRRQPGRCCTQISRFPSDVLPRRPPRATRKAPRVQESFAAHISDWY